MPDLVVWTGPVNLQQAAGATVEGAIAKAFPCTGDREPRCSEFSWSLKDASGRRLPTLASKCGTSLDAVGDIFLGAFSAGGGVLRDIVSTPEDRARIRFLHNADATYSSWADAAKTTPLINSWWVDWGEHVANGDGSQLWVATASPSPNYGLPSGVETLREMRHQIEERVGRSFTKLTSFWNIDPAPENAYQLGNIVFAEYPMEPLAHGGHANVLAKKVWQQIMWPWLAELRRGTEPVPLPPGTEPVPTEPGWDMTWWQAGALGLGGLTAWLVYKYVFGGGK